MGDRVFAIKLAELFDAVSLLSLAASVRYTVYTVLRLLASFKPQRFISQWKFLGVPRYCLNIPIRRQHAKLGSIMKYHAILRISVIIMFSTVHVRLRVLGLICRDSTVFLWCSKVNLHTFVPDLDSVAELVEVSCDFSAILSRRVLIIGFNIEMLSRF